MAKTCNKKSKYAKNKGYVCNPKTGRWVKKDGVAGKKVMGAKSKARKTKAKTVVTKKKEKTVEELKAECRRLKITGYSGLNKAELKRKCSAKKAAKKKKAAKTKIVCKGGVCKRVPKKRKAKAVSKKTNGYGYYMFGSRITKDDGSSKYIKIPIRFKSEDDMEYAIDTGIAEEIFNEWIGDNYPDWMQDVVELDHTLRTKPKFSLKGN